MTKFFRSNLILLVLVIIVGAYDITPATTQPDSVRPSITKR